MHTAPLHLSLPSTDQPSLEHRDKNFAIFFTSLMIRYSKAPELALLEKALIGAVRFEQTISPSIPRKKPDRTIAPKFWTFVTSK